MPAYHGSRASGRDEHSEVCDREAEHVEREPELEERAQRSGHDIGHRARDAAENERRDGEIRNLHNERKNGLCRTICGLRRDQN